MDVDIIVSEEGYGANPRIEVSKPLVVVTGPGGGSFVVFEGVIVGVNPVFLTPSAYKSKVGTVCSDGVPASRMPRAVSMRTSVMAPT